MIRTNEYNNTDKERDDALEYYMRRCAKLETEVAELKQYVKELLWRLEEHD